MFKLIGCTAVIFSSAVFFCRNSIIDYFTYKLWSESAKLADIFIAGNAVGMTYPSIFSTGNFDGFLFYSSKCFDRGNYRPPDNLPCRLADKKRISEIKQFFLNLGQRNKGKEQEFLSAEKIRFDFMAKNCREKYDKNRQINLIAGISCGLLVFIMII